MYFEGTAAHAERERRRRRIRHCRQGVLLTVLLGVAVWGYLNYRADTHTFAWDRALTISVIAVVDEQCRDRQEAEWFIQRFISRTAPPHQNFREVEEWIQKEYTRHTGDPSPMFDFYVRGPFWLRDLPPSLPEPTASFWERYRGVKAFIRYFEDLRDGDELSLDDSDVTVFIYFYDFHDEERRKLFSEFDSVAERRHRMGIVFAPISPLFLGNTTAIVAHELCHPLGASDKYDGVSVFPAGYADPMREPRFPQEQAEIMALGRPLSAAKDEPVRDLSECVVGEVTAREMNWSAPLEAVD